MAITVETGVLYKDQPIRDPDKRLELLDKYGRILCNEDGNNSMHVRFNALFELKSIGGQEAIDWISKAFRDESPLLKHELAYVLGQLRDVRTLPILVKVLGDLREHPMVRHEAGEAIGATGQVVSIKDLEKYLNDDEVAVRETCELSIERIKYENSLRARSAELGIPLKVESNSPYESLDPAPPEDESESKSVEQLKAHLMDISLPLFHRYRAMFSLRNLGTEEAVMALAEGFLEKSALFRHEIAYVFGQMQHEASVPSLKRVLEDLNEDSMVRHECAEALGSIGTAEALSALKLHLNDHCNIVRESCIVGLGISGAPHMELKDL